MLPDRFSMGLICVAAGLVASALADEPAVLNRHPAIYHAVIEPAGPDTPRADTASVAELPGGKLLVVYHKYQPGKEGGQDRGLCRIWCRTSLDGGRTWIEPRMLVDVVPGDMNVQAPALLRLPSGELLLICLRAHKGGASSTMCLFRSRDDSRTFQEEPPIWEKSKGQWLQGGASALMRLKSGRILLPFHGGSADQWKQTNSVGCFASDDAGRTWRRLAARIDLPRRGAMEASVAELDDGELVMSLRTQLGGPYVCRSQDGGETWSKPQPSGLESGESCTCLRRIPGTNDLLLLWNQSKYIPKGHHHFGERTPLTAAISADRGQTWRIVGDLAAGPNDEYTNLGCTFTADGKAIITYMFGTPAWNRGNLSLRAMIVDKSWFFAPTAAGKELESGVLLAALFQPSPVPADEPDPAQQPPVVYAPPGPEYADNVRMFQGIPGIERAANGRLWATWYGGGTGEDRHNYIMLATSADDGRAWSSVKLVIDPDRDGPVRAFDPCLWHDPQGRMWLFWAQRGRKTPCLWALVTGNSGDEIPQWSAPRRIATGIMMNKPVVVSDGTWLLPVALWKTDGSCHVVASTDHGAAWNQIGQANIPKPEDRNCDEHMLVQRRDGSLWMLVRTRYGIGESLSSDGGKTWSEVTPSAIAHPASRFFIRRLQSGKLLLVKHGPMGEAIDRSRLTAFLSDDDGKTWSRGLLLDQRKNVSYPDGVQAPDGTIYIIYDWQRLRDKQILLATFTEEDVAAGEARSRQARQRVVINQATAMAPPKTKK